MWYHYAIILLWFLPAGTFTRLICFDTTCKHVIVWWLKVLGIHYTMADITPTSSTPKDVKQRPRALKGIDPNNQNDNAFELVTMFVSFLCCHNSPFLFFFMLSCLPPTPRHHSLFDNPLPPHTPHLGGHISTPDWLCEKKQQEDFGCCSFFDGDDCINNAGDAGGGGVEQWWIHKLMGWLWLQNPQQEVCLLRRFNRGWKISPPGLIMIAVQKCWRVERIVA
jgi:hypothetical protein